LKFGQTIVDKSIVIDLKFGQTIIGKSIVIDLKFGQTIQLKFEAKRRV